jgi:exonuclease VII small subunit
MTKHFESDEWIPEYDPELDTTEADPIPRIMDNIRRNAEERAELAEKMNEGIKTLDESLASLQEGIRALDLSFQECISELEASNSWDDAKPALIKLLKSMVD